MKTALLSILVLVTIRLNAQEFRVDTLVFNHIGEKRINYVILGDGFTEGQLPNFRSEAESIAEYMFTIHPYDKYKNYFNVFSISVPSNESGASPSPQEPIDNYFGSSFNTAGIERLLSPTRHDRITSVLADNFPLYDQVIMLVNSTKYGGAGGWVATTSLHEEAPEIAMHEIGHSFAGLSDEYWAGPQYAAESPNMTQQTSPTAVRWANWMFAEGIGIYDHTNDPSWKKPHKDCKMQYLNAAFCSVCVEQFLYTIHGKTDLVDTYSPLIDGQPEGVVSFTADIVHPEPNTIKSTWKLNDEVVDRGIFGLDQDVSTLTGENTLSLEMYDSTLFDRRDLIRKTTITWTIDGSIFSTIDRRLAERNGSDIITSVLDEQEGLFRVFPNPVSNTLFIESDEGGSVTLISPLGRTLMYKQLNGKVGLEISGFPPGMYFLRIKRGEKSLLRKIVIE